MKKEVLKFHYEEIVYVLMILSTPLKGYSEEELKGFAEAIHRLDALSNSDFLKKLKLVNNNLDDNIISRIIELHLTISKLYSGQWYKNLGNDSEVLNRSYILSNKLLQDLNEVYIEPVKYAELYMDVNW